ncbi:MAG: DUF3131 domain-containing protein, partial [Burkholderiales bacterium]|nr:DUF3131 domain-containing protein [Burkholderiales bacterium]
MSQRLVLSFYQNPVAAAATLAGLRQQRYTRSALIQKSEGKLSVDNGGVSPRDGALAGAAIVPLAAILIHSFFPAPFSALAMAIAALIFGAAAGALFARWLVPGVSRRLLAKYKRRLIEGETLVMVQASARSVGQVLALLDKSEGAQAITFVIHRRRGPEEVLPPLRSDLLPPERLQAIAARLAAETRTKPAGSAPRLFKRLRESSRILKNIHQDLLDAARSQESFSLSSEWLLDNAYVIQGQIDDVWRNLSRRFYAELPAVANGRHAGLPRVYRIATELIDNTGGGLNRAEISGFLTAFQLISPLTMGELWALPMMLRLALVERLRHLVIGVDVRQREAEHAEFWANRLLSAARRDNDSVLPFLADLASEFPAPTAHLADELIARLSDEEAVLAPVRGWLERKLEVPLAEALREEQRRQTADQVLLGNAITTLRQLTQLDWREVFEGASSVDALLAADPVYTRMDFATRDCYRHEIERIAGRSNAREVDIARHAVDLAAAGSDELSRHVGFYLLDNGRRQLEARVHCKPSIAQRLRLWSARRPALVYVGGIVLTTSALNAGVIAIAARAGTDPAALFLLAALMLLPASEIALQIVNYVLTLLLTPRILPKMSFESGIPDEFGTLVVVPMMLLTPMSVREQIERLEIRYLGNTDANLRYALFSDFSDAPSEHMPEDAEWLELVARHIEELNLRHGAGRFFWFNRERRWSASEARWIGWERKRGKLEQLNRFLAGDAESASLLRAGDAARLRDIRFVITLDADTQLPMNTARRMVETLAHPLNRPNLAADARSVLRGYGIIQPRVSTSLPSAVATLFARCFTNLTGTDPYSHAVSDVYQDLTGEGNYHGKGIYDLEVFHRVLSGRFPEAHLLSHDLLEGAFVRVGLASDIELFDQFPADYQTYAQRQHRWIRGDWQIADWLLRSAPTAGGRERNPLSAISRWKILDNLRRSLVPFASLALLLCAWLLSATPALWSAVVAAVFLLPPCLSALNGLTKPAILTFAHWRDLGRDFLRALTLLALLPHQAVIALDAIVRVWYRRLISHRLLLQWDSAQAIERRAGGQQREFLLKMAWATTAASAIAYQINLSQAGMQFGMQAFALLWLAAPLIVIGLSRRAWHRPAQPLTEADRRMLRLIARRTWRYFDDFVDARSNWLPPDNYQEFMLAEVAQRTSPTNIGFGLLANLAARDFGYITTDDALARTQATLDTLSRLERFEGHLLNWYSTATLQPLHPRYISMVDSGNLLAACWTVQQGYEQLLNGPVIAPPALAGLADVLALIDESGAADASSAEIEALHAATATPRQPLEEIVRRIALATRHSEALASSQALAGHLDDSEQA